VGRETIRILRIVTRLNAGGPSRHISILSEGLDPLRFEQLIVHGALDRGELPISPWPKGECKSLTSLRRPLSPIQDFSAFRELRRIAAAFRPHVIHTHQAKAGILGRLVPGDARRVHTFHGHTFSGYWSGLGNRVVKGVERRLAERSDALIAQSSRQAAEIRTALGDRSDLRIIEPAVDFDLLAREKGGRLPLEAKSHAEVQRIGFVSRIAPVKDLPAFLEALAPWVRENPRDHQLVIAGRGPEMLEEQAHRQAAALQIEKSLRWLGHLEHPAALFSQLDALVLSSRNEGTPLALIEALASGARVAAYDHGGIVDTIGADPRVRMAKRGDPRALEAAAREALKIEISEAERVRADEDLRARFGPRRLLGEMSALYEELGERD
jgi:glycosyltransferase involved in cell wall biosynthesis